MHQFVKLTVLVLVYVTTIVAQTTISNAEYFIGTDPGEGNAISLTASDGSFDSATEDVNYLISTDGLSLGAHWIYIRFQDSAGNWGNPRAKMVTISNPVQGLYITEAEYFIDIDPGEGNGMQLQTVDGIFDSNIENLIGSQIIDSDFSLGEHQLSVRAKSSDGVWGQVTTETITFDDGETTPPLADFSATPTSGQVPLTVQFTDQSVADESQIVSWSWDFGDGSTSTEQNPTHIYTTQGLFTVSLTVTDDAGLSITETKQGYINTYDGPVFYISTSGSDSEGNGSEGYPFATIQHGIDASSDGDTVLVTAGTYVENINFNGKNIAVIGEDRETTIIDGNQNGSVVTFTSGEDSTAVFSGFTITNGSGTLYLSEYSGGGIYFNSASPKIENVIIKNNDARDGGGIFSYSSSPSLTNVMISNNIAFYSGGGISYTFANNPTLTNVIITENTAEWGGGIAFFNTESPILMNVTITGNTADAIGWGDLVGGGIYCSNASPTLVNCILWNNSPNAIIATGGSDTVTATYSDIEGGWAGVGNIDSNPLFTDTENGDYNLQDSSPCIGAGIDSIDIEGTWYYTPDTDIEGNSRPDPAGSNPDMGAYENELPSRIVNNIFVSNDGNDFTGDGSNENPFQNIQWAIDRAYIGDTVTVLNGSYSENLTITTDNLHLIGESQDSVIITSETSSDETIYIEDVDNILINNLTLLGNGGDGIWVYESKNYTVKNILIEGFTNYGYGFKSSKSSSSFETYGIFDSVKVINNSTGLLIYSSNLQLSNSLIDSNTIGMNIGTTNDSIFIENTSISFNGDIEENDARGIYTTGNNVFVSLDSCMLISNLSNDAGAAIRSPAELNINNCIFIDNNTDNFASAIYADGGDVTINSTRFLNNNSTFTNGSLLYKTSSNNYYIFDSIFLNNDGYMFGGTNQSSLFTVTNSVFWNNEITNDSNVNTNITYSCIENGWAGSGNISEDPQFCNPYSNSFSLSDNSPCIGTGFNNANMGGLDVGCSQTINTLYLDENGNDNGSGSIDDPINDIQLAFQRVFHEDTIFVNSGNYYPDEAVVFSKSIAFIGEDSSSAIINIENMTYLESNIQNIEDVTVLFENIKFQGSTNWTNDWVFMLWNGDYEFNKCSFFNINNTHTIRVINSNLLINKSSFNSSPTSDDINSSSTNGSSLILNDINIIQDSFIIEMPNILDSLLIENHIFESKYLDFEVGYFSLKNSVVNNCSFGLIAGENIFENNIVSNSDISLSNQYHSDKILINKCLFYDFSGQVNSYGDSLIVSKSTFVNNSNSILFQLLNSSTGNLTNSIIKTNGNDLLNLVSNQTSFNADYNLIDFSYNDGWGASNNVTITNVIYDNPLFFDPENDNYQLQWGSPAIDAGDPNSPNDPDGTRADIGALYFDQTDTESPTIYINGIVDEIGTADELVITWSANDNYDLGSAEIYYSPDSLETVLAVDTVDADIEQYTFPIPDSVITNYSSFIIHVYDGWGNSARDTSNFFSIYDNTSPVISVITPSDESQFTEYDSLNITWEATDNIEMDSVAVYFSNDDNFVFQGKVQYEEAISFVVPSGVTDNAQIKVIAHDIYGNTGEDISEYFSVTDNTPPTVSINTPENTVLGIGDSFTIEWLATDNVSELSIDLAYSADNTDFIDIATNEENDGEFNWLVPNEPTDNLILRVIATDGVGLSDTSFIEGLSIIVVYPTIVQILPGDDLLSLRESEISIQFSQPIDSTTITADNIQFESKFTDEVTSDLEYNSSEKTLHINVTTGLASMDSIFVTLIGSNLTNLFGYPLDANNDGEIGEDVILSFATQLLSDYDTTGVIDIYDLNQFVSAWYAKDYFYELGPATGTVPHLIPTYDEQYNIEDLATFLRMWNWSYSFSQPLTKELVTDGLPSSFGFEDSRLIMTLPETDEIVSAMRVSISCLNADVEINSNLEDEFTFALVRNWKDVAIKELNLARTNLNDSLKTIVLGQVKGDRNLVYIDIRYEVLNPDGFVISRGYKTVEYIPLPIDYILYPAYPNPFNPVATIEFGLPVEKKASIIIYDITGREVVRLINKSLPAGYHKVKWVASNQASGIYFVRMISGKFIKVQKIMLIK